MARLIPKRALGPFLAVLALSAHPYRMSVAYCTVACLPPATHICREWCLRKAPPIPRHQRRME